MNDAQQREAAKKFAEKWNTEKGYEKGQTQKFWNELLRDVYGVERPEDYVDYEVQVKGEKTTSFIDGLIDYTHVMIEQKGSDVDLRKKYRQSDGSMRTPYQQTKKYSANIDYDRRPRWTVVCNFREFHVHDQKQPSDEPKYIIHLSELEKDYNLMNFLVDPKTEEQYHQEAVSKAAGEIVGKLYDALAAQYDDPDSQETALNLNILCVRLVFCLYAEDAGIFETPGMFRKYLGSYSLRDMHKALLELFRVLDMTQAERDAYDKYMSRANPQLAAFPYVNGGLFRNEKIDIPPFTEEIRDLLLKEASAKWRWNSINPTIFGALFESTLDRAKRRKGGMHYTSIENIHKVIDPLFLNSLKAELAEIMDDANYKPKKKSSTKSKKKSKNEEPNAMSGATGEKREKLLAFQEKLANLSFLDTACGSGNFLTETYLSLRRLENEVITELTHGQLDIAEFEHYSKIHVQISQFYGIEINDFAVSVARTALWIAESQMMKETENIIKKHLDFLPLRTKANIHEGNALRMDWDKEVIPREKLNYIISNPPFVGFKFATSEQKDDMKLVFGNDMKPALLDYVTCWYKKSAEFIQGTRCEVAFVSTNSVCQGQMAGDLWSLLLEKYSIKINFAWPSFVWESESLQSAHVHAVIVGFACFDRDTKMLYQADKAKRPLKVENINPYLVEGSNVLVKSRHAPLYDVPPMIMGNQAMDGGNLIIEEKDYADFIANEPKAIPYIKRYMMGNEFINNKKRWCLWLVGCSPAELRKMPSVMRRVKAVQKMRESSNDAGARKRAATPMLFREQRNPKKFIAIPIVSSENRNYVPMGYLDDAVIAGNKLFIIPDATIYHFGVLTSGVHMAWMRTVGGRLKSDYTYSKDIVYNNFPWPEPEPNQREKIEKTAQAILDARAKFPDSSLADLYDEVVMPPELRRAHQENDRAVMEAYGFVSAGMNEAACVAELMKLYAEKDKAKKAEEEKAKAKKSESKK